MAQEVFQKQLSEAKRLFFEKRYEESLSRLLAINKQHPGMFNVQYPMLQCLQRLGRFEDARRVLDGLQRNFTEEKYQNKIRKAENRFAVDISNIPPEHGNTKETPGTENTSSEIAGQDTQKKHAARTTPSYPRLSTSLRALLISAEVVVILAIVFLGMYFLLKNMDVAPEFSADIVLELQDARFDGKLYFKNSDLNRTEIMEQMFITKDGRVHRLMPSEGYYFKSSKSDLERHNPLVSASNLAAWARHNNAEKIGRETLQGFVCDIYQARKNDGQGAASVLTKVWYARRLRFPIKSETVLNEQEAKVVVSLENIRTDVLPGTLFQIPTHYAELKEKPGIKRTPEEIQELPSNLHPLLEELDTQLLLDTIASEE